MSLANVQFRPPRIETERLVLRGYEPTDASAIFLYASDPETTQYMGWNRHTSLADAHLFLDCIVKTHYEQTELDYAITKRAGEERVIGGIGVFWNPREHRVMELGYILARDHWGSGLVPEAGRALLRHAFTSTDVERIFAPIFADNRKSRRAAEKLGLRLDGVLRSNREVRGVRRDEAIYSILRVDLPTI
jgi:ribosomal-protein-alanine N-acetyltransferase